MDWHRIVFLPRDKRIATCFHRFIFRFARGCRCGTQRTPCLRPIRRVLSPPGQSSPRGTAPGSSESFRVLSSRAWASNTSDRFDARFTRVRLSHFRSSSLNDRVRCDSWTTALLWPSGPFGRQSTLQRLHDFTFHYKQHTIDNFLSVLLNLTISVSSTQRQQSHSIVVEVVFFNLKKTI